jgi:hypothetical protein
VIHTMFGIADMYNFFHVCYDAFSKIDNVTVYKKGDVCNSKDEVANEEWQWGQMTRTNDGDKGNEQWGETNGRREMNNCNNAEIRGVAGCVLNVSMQCW